MESALYDLSFDKDYNLLIVDDIPDNLQLLSTVLYKKNVGISIATSGQQALAILAERQFDLILLDVSMPEMDGYEVCKRIKANENLKDIPVIFLTARSDIESITQGFQAGGQDYVTKPFNNQELLMRVKNHLELKDQRDALQSMNQILERKVLERTAQIEYTNIQLENANESLGDANRKLAKLDRAKNDFLLLINHELRTPLHGIRGLISVLEESLQMTEYEEYIRSINKSAEKLVRLAEMSLLITTLKADSYKKTNSLVKIQSVVENVYMQSAKDALQKNIQLLYESETPDIEINTDLDLLTNAFKIVIENAIEHTENNTEVLIKTSSNNNACTINVIDTGNGFSAFALKNGLEMFVAEDMNQKKPGFGLGLSTSKLIIEALSGHISLANTAQGGAIVQIVLPISI